MDQSREETQLLLASLLQEYRTICQEVKATTDSDREQELRAWAAACIADYLATIQQHRASKQTETIVSP